MYHHFRLKLSRPKIAHSIETPSNCNLQQIICNYLHTVAQFRSTFSGPKDCSTSGRARFSTEKSPKTMLTMPPCGLVQEAAATYNLTIRDGSI
jgi:hypothetical protein